MSVKQTIEAIKDWEFDGKNVPISLRSIDDLKALADYTERMEQALRQIAGPSPFSLHNWAEKIRRVQTIADEALKDIEPAKETDGK